MIGEIESVWRETPIECPHCGSGFVLYSDGVHWPRCAECFYLATQEDVLGALIRSTLVSLERDQSNFTLRVLRCVAGALGYTTEIRMCRPNNGVQLTAAPVVASATDVDQAQPQLTPIR